MATFEINVEGLTELRARLTAAAGRLDSETHTATSAAAAVAEKAVKEQLRQSSHQKGTVTPADPGQPPSLITGNLMRSVAINGPTGRAGAYKAEIGPTAVYGRIQELGGNTGRGHRTHLPRRPYVQPAWAEAAPEVTTTYLAAWSRVFE